jgi:hypothetical protein
MTREEVRILSKLFPRESTTSSPIDWSLDPDLNFGIFLQGWYRWYGTKQRTAERMVEDSRQKWFSEKVIRVILRQLDETNQNPFLRTIEDRLYQYLWRNRHHRESGLWIHPQKKKGEILWQVEELDAVLLDAGYYDERKKTKVAR